jgi:hypothetical protein
MTKKNLRKDSVPLREQMAYLECINGAWISLKDTLGPALLKKRSISATSFYWLLNNTIPSALLHYGIVFKANNSGKQYYEALPFAYIEFACKDRKNYKRALLTKLDKYVKMAKENHSLLNILLENCRSCDEATNEGGIIGRLADLMKNSQNIDISIKKALHFFASRMDERATSIRENFAHPKSHCSSFVGRKIDNVLAHTKEILVEICDALLSERKEEIIYVVDKEKRQCKKMSCICFYSKALTGDATIQLCSHLHCSPSFSFYSSSPPTATTCMICKTSLTSENAVYWACGCNFCRACNPTKCRCTVALRKFMDVTRDSISEIYKRKLIDTKQAPEISQDERNLQNADDQNDEGRDDDDLDAPTNHITALNDNCQRVIQRDIVSFENEVPAAALPPPAASFPLNGKQLQFYKKGQLNDEINKFSYESVRKFNNNNHATYMLDKEGLIVLLYNLLKDKEPLI